MINKETINLSEFENKLMNFTIKYKNIKNEIIKNIQKEKQLKQLTIDNS